MPNLVSFQSAAEHNNLPHIDSVSQIDDDDLRCFDEVREVLLRHDKLSRFGMALLHKHFDLSDGETLVETTDEARREQYLAPSLSSVLDGQDVIPTVISLEHERAEAGCYRSCVYTNGKHSVKHVTAGN